MTNLVTKLVRAQQYPVIGRLAKEMLSVYGVEFPSAVQTGRGLNIVHRGFGVVIHPKTVIGENVTLYHAVTIARADSWVPLYGREFPGVEIGDYAVICPGAKILGATEGLLRVGTGTVIGANAVLTRSTGDWEVWAGNPAKKISDRADRTGVK